MNKIVSLIVFLVAGYAYSAEQQIDVGRVQQLCDNASPQQRQMARAAGYDIDELCASIDGLSTKPKRFEDPPLVNERMGKGDTRRGAKRQNKNMRGSSEFVSTLDKETDRLNPLDFLTPEQLAELSPEQLLLLLAEQEDPDKEEELELQPFGYDLFAGEPTTFAPATQFPVPSNYIMGPGDIIDIQLYGKMSQQYSLQIDRLGKVQFPELGPISLAGLSFADMKNLIQSRVKEQMIGVDSHISLGELRSIQVFILGEAYQPGSYTVSALSTITNALFVSGGINDIGSLRNIMLKRQGKTISHLDLYDLLLKGDISKDVRLLSGDVVYIPPVGKTVSIDGAIRRPAIYELKNEKSVSELVKMAGGLLADAFMKQAELTRIREDGFTTVVDIEYPKKSNTRLRNGDSLKIKQSIDMVDNVITLSGHVHHEKRVSWKSGLRISDLMPNISVLKPHPQVEAALLVREQKPLRNIYVEIVNLSKVLEDKKSTENRILKPQDELIVLGFNEERELLLTELISKLEAQSHSQALSQVASISGMVRFPGDYPLAKNMTAADMIALAGGLAESAYTLSGEVTRIDLENPEKAEIRHFPIHFQESMEASGIYSFQLLSRDVVNIRQKPEYREFAQVEVKGEVKFPGIYRVRKGETLKDLMKRVGGFSDFAHVEATVFTREELKEREKKQLRELRERLKSDIASAQLEQTNIGKTANIASLEQLSDSLESTEALGRLVVDVKSILADKLDDLILKDGDQIVVPALRQEVSVMGEVQHPASHLFSPNLTLEEYIERSGGETEKADDDRVYVVKADGSVVLPNKSGWINSMGVNIEPGDTIIVPLDVDSINSLALWTQVSQIVYQIALGAAAIKSL